MTRVAIVTGGSRGIGRAAAERLAADGMAVVIVYAGNQTEAGKTVEGIKASGGQAVAAQADVGDENAVAAAFDVAEQTFGGVDVVVNSAGIMPLGTVAEMDLEVFDRIMRTNARGTFVVSQQAARRLRTGGAIINVSSSVVGLRFPQYGAYAMSKGGVEALTLVLARELRGRDITVNTVAPGPTATALFLEGKDEETVANLAKQAPLERIGVPEDISEVVSFLAGPARWINGQTIRANGGII
ncbi:3-oxoacyl-[acyl-carrier protein] reductase [Lentzea xinjiangensis]|uniref:3-oxoacyl-[acyl-carrier protein] reductase n=1 Tax=Lentzea xinjiangensis TaxID=402600 RepID=A0A1H9JPX6_9PSEU|nr:SDR family oxidoreductase [Lentzea xinjiangensis]SEQ88902.1 3-oxoacyl-[acyl-carrier protein] reductase [Lentzea xinjiangensis]